MLIGAPLPGPKRTQVFGYGKAKTHRETAMKKRFTEARVEGVGAPRQTDNSLRLKPYGGYGLGNEARKCPEFGCIPLEVNSSSRRPAVCGPEFLWETPVKLKPWLNRTKRRR